MSESEEQFTTYIGSIINSTMIGHGINLGKKTGLLKIVMDLDQPKTSEEIAKIGNMKERYVREWLNLMVCGKIVEYKKFQKTYVMPDYKRAVFQPGAATNLHMFGTVLSFMPVQPHLEKCFKLDGPNGVPMKTYEGFAFHHHSHEDQTLGLDKMKDILSAFPSLYSKLENGTTVFEAGCGSGILSSRVASGFIHSKVHGVDVSKEAIEKAKNRAVEQNIENVTFAVSDLSNMAEIQNSHFEFAYAHFVIHDVPKASVALKEIYRILKPGGTFLMIDVNMHSDVADNHESASAILAYAASLNFAMPVSLAEDGGEGLGPTWGIENMQDYLKAAGFVNVHLPCQPSGRNAFVIGFKSE